MKQKLTVLLVGALFVLSAFATLAGPSTDLGTATDAADTETAEASTTMQTYHVAPPEIATTDTAATVVLEGAEYTHEPGCPILPYETRTMTFPFGTRIVDVTVSVNGVETRPLEYDVAPAAPATPLNHDEPAKASKGAVYEGTAPYPSEWVRWHTAGGLHEGEHAAILSLQVFPARYIPAAQELEYADTIQVEVAYTPPSEPISVGEGFDLLIVAPQDFTDVLQPLVQHKEDHGLATKLVTTDEIYAAAQGRDNAEKIKYYIKDAVEDWGVKYVLLAGGLKSLIMGQNWHVPVRYVHNSMGSEPTYISDLYYADIYDAEGNFSSWDDNSNGRYSEWGWGGDTVDGYPDVYVGRLACRNTNEVETVVNKIINYETTAAGSEWFNRVVLAAGDTFPDPTDTLEGEVTTQRTAEILKGFDPIKIWWSNGGLQKPLTGQSNVIDAISQGSGFVHFSGHGSPGMWMAKNYVNGDGEYILGLEVYHMQLLQNDGQYGIWVIGGCHNSMFNTTLADSAKGCVKSLTGSPTWYWMPVPECFGWWPVKVRAGGAIATIGCTGLGYGASGDTSPRDGVPDCLQHYLGWLELRFFELYGEKDVDILGDTWGKAISDYANTFPPMGKQIDLKTVQEWVLLGDPSLKIGGYE